MPKSYSAPPAMTIDEPKVILGTLKTKPRRHKYRAVPIPSPGDG
ncbi:MAG: hypothetical protein Ct9H300mP11_16730 [Chloroflexota bacterium]|nr:MAG: hypothetical protein Ct9H300mP11_16730 [Chloroflexota bacterium]